MARLDLPWAEAIAERVHPDLPEDPSVFAERLRLFPSGCLMLEHTERPVGYVIAHPWFLGRPPNLDTLVGQLPGAADTFFIHDLALLPEARGRGHAAEAVRLLVAQARVLAIATLSLVAVGASPAFWRHLGFQPVNAAGNLASYGAGACYMVGRTALLPGSLSDLPL